MQRDHEQTVLGGFGRDPGKRPNLGVAKFAAGHGRGDFRHAGERMGDPHLFPRRAQIEAALEIQPMSAGMQGAVSPALATVVLGNQGQPAVVRGIQLAGELGDLCLQILDRQVLLRPELISLLVDPPSIAIPLSWLDIQYPDDSERSVGVTAENAGKIRLFPQEMARFALWAHAGI